MRVHYIFCTGEREPISRACALLGGTDLMFDRYPAQHNNDYFGSFMLNTDDLTNPEIPHGASSDDVVRLLREWSSGVIAHGAVCNVDHARTLESYMAETRFAGAPLVSLTESDRAELDAHVHHQRETFHANEPPEDDADDEPVIEESDDEEEFDTVDRNNDEHEEDDDDEDRILYDEADPLE